MGRGSSLEAGVLLAFGAIGLGGFTIARRSLAPVWDGITDLPVLAALIVPSVCATIIPVLSALGIPPAFVISSTCCSIRVG